MGPILGSPYFGKLPYRDHGKEDGNNYIVIGNTSGLYRDHGKENGSYYLGVGDFGVGVQGFGSGIGEQGSRCQSVLRGLCICLGLWDWGMELGCLYSPVSCGPVFTG